MKNKNTIWILMIVALWIFSLPGICKAEFFYGKVEPVEYWDVAYPVLHEQEQTDYMNLKVNKPGYKRLIIFDFKYVEAKTVFHIQYELQLTNDLGVQTGVTDMVLFEADGKVIKSPIKMGDHIGCNITHERHHDRRTRSLYFVVPEYCENFRVALCARAYGTKAVGKITIDRARMQIAVFGDYFSNYFSKPLTNAFPGIILYMKQKGDIK